MAFDQEKWNSTAGIADVAGITIDNVVALRKLTSIFHKIQYKIGVDLTEELREIDEIIDSMRSTFDDMTGWVKDADL